MSGTILVTGSSGFIGRALLERLRSSGHDVTATQRSDGDIAGELRVAGPFSHVIHLAARTFIPDSWEDPAEFYRVNTQGTASVLELCRRQGCGLTFLSSYIYGAPVRLPVTEDHPLRPNNPYSHSKMLAEEECRFYSEYLGVPVTTLRPFNIYGPGQRDSFLVPTIVRQALSPETTTIEVMDLEPRRDLLFIDDLLDAIVATLGRSRSGTFNVGSGSSVSVAELVRTVLEVARLDKPVRAMGQRRPDEILDLYADITRIRNELGWRPRVSLEQGIARVVDSVR